MKRLNKKQKAIILIAIILIAIIIGIVISINVIKINIANGKYNTANNNSSSANLLPEYIKKGITLGGVTGSLIDLNTSDATATEWDITYGKTAYVDGKKITGVFVPRSSLEVGDYVSYTPDTASVYSLLSTVSGYTSNQTISQENVTWQILSINDDGTIDIITSNSVGTEMYFNGSLGYNNSVYALNDMCSKLYSNKALGLTARSINFDEIETKMNSAGIQARNSYRTNSTVNIQYNHTYTYTGDYTYYPVLYAQENGSGINTTTTKTNGINKSDSYYSSPTTNTHLKANSLTATQTYYTFSVEDTKKYFDDKSFYNLIFGENQELIYWVASRYNNQSNRANYGIRKISYGSLAADHFYDANNTPYCFGYKIRPVVNLNSNIKIYGGDGSEEHPYQLSK